MKSTLLLFFFCYIYGATGGNLNVTSGSQAQEILGEQRVSDTQAYSSDTEEDQRDKEDTINAILAACLTKLKETTSSNTTAKTIYGAFSEASKNPVNLNEKKIEKLNELIQDTNKKDQILHGRIYESSSRIILHHFIVIKFNEQFLLLQSVKDCFRLKDWLNGFAGEEMITRKADLVLAMMFNEELKQAKQKARDIDISHEALKRNCKENKLNTKLTAEEFKEKFITPLNKAISAESDDDSYLKTINANKSLLGIENNKKYSINIISKEIIF